MDSKDYLSLLDDPNPTWQQVDNDTSNSGGDSTHVSREYFFVLRGLVNFNRKELTKHVDMFRHVKI